MGFGVGGWGLGVGGLAVRAAVSSGAGNSPLGLRKGIGVFGFGVLRFEKRGLRQDSSRTNLNPKPGTLNPNPYVNPQP